MKALAGLRSLLAPAVLFALLVLLATLQYRWAGAVSDAERVRLRQGAQARAAALADAFDREVTRAALWLQLSSRALDERDWRAFSEAWARWDAGAPFPRMLRQIVLLDATRTPAEALRYEPEAGGFVAAPWPAELSGLAARLARAPGWRPPFPQGPILIEPAGLLLPIHEWEAAGPSARPPRLQASYLVILFDADVLRSEVFPALERRFAPEDRVAVEAPGGLVYASPGLDPAGAEPDAIEPIFGVRFADRDAALLEGIAPEFRARHRHHPGRFGGPRRAPGEEGGWRLQLASRAGPLAAVVEGARRRNLAIGFGVLVLLGLGAALVLRNAQREALLARQQMEFVAGISHELRTPIAVIRSAAENLRDGVVEDPARVREYGLLLRLQGQRLTELVENVLHFVGSYSGQAQSEARAVDVGQAVDQVLEGLGGSVEVERKLAPELPRAWVDPAGLRRALENLVQNGVKYANGNPWLAVRAGYDAGRNELSIAVEDRGIGIQPSELPRLFEPFFRGRGAVERQIPGSGLGLHLVQRFAEGAGGHVSIRSTPGAGTTVTLHLPAAPAETPA
jgi:signal transduction histidine kinase